MKKILFLNDGDHFAKGAFEFIKMLRETEPLFVKGMFFTPVDMEEVIPISFMPIAAPLVKLKENELLTVHKTRKRFVSECASHGIKQQVHEYEGCWDRDLFVKESRFADLVVISEELFFLDSMNAQPGYFMEEMLRSSECAVMVIPEKFSTLDRLAVAYDGSREAMFALKQFVNLFPDFTNLPAELVHVKNVKEEELPDRELLQEYSSCHFDSLYAKRLHFEADKYFSAWLEDKKTFY